MLVSHLIFTREDLTLPFPDGDAEATKASKRPRRLPEVAWPVGGKSGLPIRDGREVTERCDEDRGWGVCEIVEKSERVEQKTP